MGLVNIAQLTRIFDVSKPWLNRPPWAVVICSGPKHTWCYMTTLMLRLWKVIWRKWPMT